MTLPDFGAFPLARKSRPFDAFQVGQELVHHWGRTVTDGDNALFSTATCNWNPMHLNVEFARFHGHPTVVVNSMLVLSLAVGLSVEDLSESGGAFLGIDNCSFHRPMYPGDTMTARSTVVSKRLSETRPQNGIVTWHTEGRNQHDELLVEFDRTNLIARTWDDVVSLETRDRTISVG